MNDQLKKLIEQRDAEFEKWKKHARKYDELDSKIKAIKAKGDQDA